MPELDGPAFLALLEIGRQSGRLSYRQVNDWLGGDADPALIDALLARLEAEGIELHEDAPAEPALAPSDRLALGERERTEHAPRGDPALHRAFLDDVIACPEDDGPRLIYADWLDDQGEAARAEFIRVQCALARLDEDDPERDALLDRQRRAEAAGWWEPSPPGAIDFRRERGLPQDVGVRLDWLLENGEELFRSAPVRRLRLRGSRFDAPEQAERFAAMPLLARLEALDLGDTSLWDHHLGPILASPHLRGLVALGLADNPILPQGIALLAEADLPRLTWLDLDECGVTDEDVRALAAAPFAAGLRTLRLGQRDPEGAYLSDEAVRALADAPLAELRTLSLAGNRYTAAGVAALARSPNLFRLEALDTSAFVDWVGEFHPRRGLAEALAGSPLAGRLRDLDLTGQRLGVGGITALAEAPMPRLRRLTLDDNDLGDEGVRVLLRAGWAPGLRSLSLSDNCVGAAGVRALGEAVLPNLRELDLRRNAFGRDCGEALAASPQLGRLRRLSLADNGLDEADNDRG
jgi:uncharacterized protein (TIGR02996 family)